MKTKHTPGPWRCAHLSTEQAQNNLVHTFEVYTNANAEHSNRIGNANALLIEATPETAKTLFETYAQLLKDLPYSLRDTLQWQGLLSSMRATLAQAYGMDPQQLEDAAKEHNFQP